MYSTTKHCGGKSFETFTICWEIMMESTVAKPKNKKLLYKYNKIIENEKLLRLLCLNPSCLWYHGI